MENQLLKALLERHSREWEKAEQQAEARYRAGHHISTRRNQQLEAAVNRGLAAAYLVNLAVGATMMREEGVPPEVVTRVLRHPELRRSSDWKR